MPDGVVFLPSFHEAIKDLPDDQRLNAFDAVAWYGLSGVIIEMHPTVRALFTLMKPVIDSSQNRHRAAKENGSKPAKDGSNPRGRPSKNQTENQSKNQTENHEIETDIDFEIETDIDLKMENVTDSENETEREKKRLGGGGRTTYRPLTEEAFEMKRESALNMLQSIAPMNNSGFSMGS